MCLLMSVVFDDLLTLHRCVQLCGRPSLASVVWHLYKICHKFLLYKVYKVQILVMCKFHYICIFKLRVKCGVLLDCSEN